MASPQPLRFCQSRAAVSKTHLSPSLQESPFKAPCCGLPGAGRGRAGREEHSPNASLPSPGLVGQRLREVHRRAQASLSLYASQGRQPRPAARRAPDPHLCPLARSTQKHHHLHNGASAVPQGRYATQYAEVPKDSIISPALLLTLDRPHNTAFEILPMGWVDWGWGWGTKEKSSQREQDQARQDSLTATRPPLQA